MRPPPSALPLAALALLLPGPAPAQAPSAPVGEKPASQTAEQVFLRDQAVLLPAWRQTLELSASYARAVSDQVVARVEDRGVEARLAWRLGIASDVQISTRLPWRHRRSTVLGADGSQRNLTRQALGDLSAGLFAVVLRERRGLPNLLLTLDGLLPTGPGEAGVGGGLAATKSYDPVILFAGASYTRGLRPRPGDASRTLSRNNLGFNAGAAFAMNESVAVTGQLIGTFHDFESAVPPRPIRELYRVQLGVTLLAASGLFVEPTVAVAVASGSPDLTLGLNLPWTF